MSLERKHMGNKSIAILDSTLRDGAQSEGISFSAADKLAIIRELDALGVGYIEVGIPASNPKDREIIEKARELELTRASLVAFGATRHSGVSAEQDAGLNALLAAGTHTVSIFGKCWRLHTEEILCVTQEENRDMIEQSCRYLADAGRQVFFDAEHFFDGYDDDPEFALSMLRAAAKGGAELLVLCDTNGGGFPDRIASVTAEVCRLFPELAVGIHCHNDNGMATACSVMAVQAGATHVQGTLLGLGERCGNTPLSAFIPTMQLRRGYSIIPDCSRLVSCARAVAEICNVSVRRYEPYIGRSAFAHKAGMHTDAVIKNPRSYEQIPPEAVGGERRLLISEISGRGVLLDRLRSLLPNADKNSPETMRIMERLKQLEHDGYRFEGAQASLELMVLRCLGKSRDFFKVRNYRILCTNPHDPECSAAAMVKVRVGNDEVLRSAEGNGPVHALDKALRLALKVFYPQLAQMHLSDYKVRVMDSKEATGAVVRVSIISTDGKNEWSTMGVSHDIIEASFAALCDSVEYKLLSDSKAQP